MKNLRPMKAGVVWLSGSCQGSLPGAVSPVRQHKKNIYVTNHAVAAEVLRTHRQRGNADEQVVDVPLVVRRTDLRPEAEAELVMQGVAG